MELESAYIEAHASYTPCLSELYASSQTYFAISLGDVTSIPWAILWKRYFYWQIIQPAPCATSVSVIVSS